MAWIGLERWSPYAAGIGLGVLTWFAFLLSDRTIGCSTPFSRAGGMIERLLRGDKALARPYYHRVKPELGWDVMLVVGVVIGALVSSLLSGRFSLQWAPALWAATFGAAPWPRLATALVGGVLMGIGSRWADGCTSGHGISGTLQLSASSWLAVIAIFAGGIATAFFVFGVSGG
ncbi:MAG: YeeE/YedE family protein [Anaerolineae bacterium]|nr:YeeE/YedE family protein [Anaerolineae bacterium]